MRICWFGKKLDYFPSNYVWDLIYTLRIRELPAYRDEHPLYVRYIHRLVIESDERYYLHVYTPEGFQINKQFIGSIEDIDAGRLLLDLVYVYMRSYFERSRGLGIDYEHMDPGKVRDRLEENLPSLKPPVVVGLVENLVIEDKDKYSKYSQLALHINWNYVLEFI